MKPININNGCIRLYALKRLNEEILHIFFFSISLSSRIHCAGLCLASEGEQRCDSFEHNTVAKTCQMGKMNMSIDLENSTSVPIYIKGPLVPSKFQLKT